ncbi:MAG: signal peptidase I [Gammaproteobacteria bacterium]|nr:MAG: signal peptidase I [Gammaproteobacteria bacterium]
MGATYNFFLYLFVFISGLGWLTSRLCDSNLYVLKRWTLKTQKLTNTFVVQFSKKYFPFFFAVLIVKSFAYDSFAIPSISMSPTLLVGDFVLVNRYVYGVRIPFTSTVALQGTKPGPGDVVVFNPPHMPNKYLVKRVIGVPGDSIHLDDYRLTINGREVPRHQSNFDSNNASDSLFFDETLGAHSYTTSRSRERSLISSHGDWVVPQGQYFVMGDNRDSSSDSREWGTIQESDIYGKAVVVWMHKPGIFNAPEFHRNGPVK